MSEQIDPNNTSPYNYPLPDGRLNAGPTLWICILFVTLYSISTITHLGQSLFTRRWFLIPTIVLGGCGELVGWGGRLWSSKNPPLDTPFLMQISTTIISPTFLSAANFIILGRIVTIVGPQFSRLSPRNYARIFLTADVVALVIQAIGGGMASSADTPSGSENGGNVMLAGIIIQLIAITFFAGLAADFVINLSRQKPVRRVEAVPTGAELPMRSVGSSDEEVGMSKEMQGRQTGDGGMTRNSALMLSALMFSTLLLFIRSIYRTVELSDGWNGRIISTEVYFNVLDGGMVTLSMFTLNFFHPSWLIYPKRS